VRSKSKNKVDALVSHSKPSYCLSKQQIIQAMPKCNYVKDHGISLREIHKQYPGYFDLMYKNRTSQPDYEDNNTELP